MAIKSIGKIVLYNSYTQDEIDSLLSGSDTIVFEIEKTYQVGERPNNSGAVVNVDFSGSSPNYIDALKNVIDASSFLFEQDSTTYKIKYDEILKQFDLQDSFVRVNKDTSMAQGIVPDGKLLNATFATPGIEGLVFTTIQLPFNQPISVVDKDNLKAVGIDVNLTVTGSLFSIKTQKVPYKVSFSKPLEVLEDYIIDFELQNKTIEI